MKVCVYKFDALFIVSNRWELHVSVNSVLLITYSLNILLCVFFHCSIIVDKIDEDKNNVVDMSELKNWISFTQRRYIEDDVDRQWKQHNPDNLEQLNWEVSHFDGYSYSFSLILLFSVSIVNWLGVHKS